MPATSTSKRQGDAIALAGLATLNATDAMVADAMWARHAPSNVRDLLHAMPILRDLTTFTATVLKASKGVAVAIGASYTLHWSGNEWSGGGATLTKTYVLSLLVGDVTWKGEADERGGDVILRSKEPGFIRVSLTRKTLIPLFLIGLSAVAWNGTLMRYVNPTGRTVSPKAIKQAVNTFTRSAKDELVGLTRKMNAGTLSVPEWQVQAAQHIKAVHTAADVAGAGGWDALKEQGVGRIGRNLAFQLDRLESLARTLPDLSDDQAVARIGLFDDSAASLTFETATFSVWSELAQTGVTVEELNVLGQADHCGPSLKKNTPGCPEETERGWVPLGELSRPGTRTCNVNCRCYVARRRKPD